MHEIDAEAPQPRLSAILCGPADLGDTQSSGVSLVGPEGIDSGLRRDFEWIRYKRDRQIAFFCKAFSGAVEILSRRIERRR